jgi:hypothetical protein
MLLWSQPMFRRLLPRRPLALAGLILLWIGIGSPAPAATPALFEQVDQMMNSLSEITGWKVHHKVPAEIMGKEKFRKLVESGAKEANGDKELRAEEIALKMFGFVPPNFNLARESADLVTEQAAAFYDYTKKRLFVLDSTDDGAEQQLALAHELAHALADQQYSLGKFMRRGSPDDEASSARQAVMEGQASWLSWAYMSKRNGGKAEVPAQLLDRLADGVGAEGADFPVFTQAPLYVRESLVFPYEAGMRFQDAVYRKRGKAAFDEVFRNPPRDTQQIMHPDLYLESRQPTAPSLPPLEQLLGKDARNFRLLTEGNVGEFDFSVLLRQYIGDPQGADAASHWRGGVFRIYEHKRDKYPILTYAAEWDSPASARAYFEMYERVLRGKWKSMMVGVQTDSSVSGSGDSGEFQMSINGGLVQAIEGLKPGIKLALKVNPNQPSAPASPHPNSTDVEIFSVRQAARLASPN